MIPFHPTKFLINLVTVVGQINLGSLTDSITGPFLRTLMRDRKREEKRREGGHIFPPFFLEERRWRIFTFFYKKKKK